MHALLQQYSDIHTVLLGAAQKDQSLLMLVTAQTHCNSWLCALAASPLRDTIDILPSLSRPSVPNLKVTAYSLPLSTPIHPVGYLIHHSLSQSDSKFWQISLSLAPFFLISAIMVQLGYKLMLMFALLWSRRWSLGKDPIRQKDNTLSYIFLMTGNVYFFLKRSIHLWCVCEYSAADWDQQLNMYLQSKLSPSLFALFEEMKLLGCS